MPFGPEENSGVGGGEEMEEVLRRWEAQIDLGRRWGKEHLARWQRRGKGRRPGGGAGETGAGPKKWTEERLWVPEEPWGCMCSGGPAERLGEKQLSAKVPARR